MMRFSNADDVYTFLNLYLNFERKAEPTEYRLDRMHALHRDFGMPDRAYRIIHVAGSKGKGSTSAMLASILQQAGHRVGLFTSPHFLSFTERIMINQEPVGLNVLIPAAQELAAYMDGKSEAYFPGGENPTYFELLTILGFLCFRKAACDIVVVEVGLGGRLDSTNVVQPELCAITPIELEHTELLGDTIAKIAMEKAGIMKKGIPVFTNAKKPEALAVFRTRAQELGCALHELDALAAILDVHIDTKGTSFTLSMRDGTAADTSYRCAMIGSVQAHNASLAILMARSLGIAEQAIQ
ncbi:MAG TPA: Mur ligase family protein, partial [Spirochaetales bacterium]|nr:Mur ligase family protein [Spirochaetales bacterium]